MKQKLVALIAFSLLFAQSESARSARNSRRAGSRSRTSNVRVSGTTTTITANASDTTTVSTDYSKPAPITDAVAKRLCDKMVVAQLEANTTKFKTAAEAYARLTFPAYTSGMTGANETFCANFLEDSVAKLWNSYDSYTKNDEKVCNIAKARATAAEQCYQYAISEGNRRNFKDEGMWNITQVFSESDLDDYCGDEAIKKAYSLYSNGDTITDAEIGTSLTRPFSRVGASGWANLLAYSRMLDLKFDTRSTEWPREIIQLVNSINTQGQIACGRDFAAQLKDTSFQLVDKSSSFEKRVNEKGLLAGGKDWIVDQIGAIKGTNWANDFKAGKTKEEREQAKVVKNLSEAKETLKDLDKKYKKLIDDNKDITNNDIEKIKQDYNKKRNDEGLPAESDINEKLNENQIEKVNDLNDIYNKLDKAIKAEVKKQKADKKKSEKEAKKKGKLNDKKPAGTGEGAGTGDVAGSSSGEGDGTGSSSGEGSAGEGASAGEGDGSTGDGSTDEGSTSDDNPVE